MVDDIIKAVTEKLSSLPCIEAIVLGWITGKRYP